ncbi:hypothetical protein MBLNU230_g5007t1 [Neophaeotheca triangularis]
MAISMDSRMEYPPSPQLSDEDLDALLNAQGKLSSLPTPPPSKSPPTKTSYPTPPQTTDTTPSTPEGMDLTELPDRGFDYEARAITANQQPDTETRIAAIFAFESRRPHIPTVSEFHHVRNLLWNIRLDKHVEAMTYNILVALTETRRAYPHKWSEQPVLLTVAACAKIAMGHYYDDAPPAKEWADNACYGMFTARRLNRSVLAILEMLDWRLSWHTTNYALQFGTWMLDGGRTTLPPFVSDMVEMDVEYQTFRCGLTRGPCSDSVCRTLRVAAGINWTWRNGLPTPEF